MTTRWLVALSMLPALFTSCAFFASDHPEEAEPRRRMELARSLESAGHLREATHEYAIVIESFPGSSYFPTALKKSGMLLCTPGNPSRNDSLALARFTSYLTLPMPVQERELVTLQTSLLGNILSLERAQAAMSDSMAAQARKAANTIYFQNGRITELEAALQAANGELQQLKDVDVRMSRGRRQR